MKQKKTYARPQLQKHDPLRDITMFDSGDECQVKCADMKEI